MKKFLFVAVLTLLSLQTVYSAEKYAVIICGDLGSGGFGGLSAFWNDTFITWEMLIKQGFDQDKITVLYGDNAIDYITYDGLENGSRYKLKPSFITEYGLNFNGNYNITDYSATKIDIRNIASTLKTTMNENDFLFVKFIGHGGWGTYADSVACFTEGDSNNQPPSTLTEDKCPAFHIIRPPEDDPDFYPNGPNGYLEGWDAGPFDIVTDSIYAIWFNSIPANKKVYWMGSCFSGGYKRELTENQDNVYFVSAARWFEQTYYSDQADETIYYYSSNNDGTFNKLQGIHSTPKGEHSEIFWHMICTSMGERIEDGLPYYYFNVNGNSAYFYNTFNSADTWAYTDGYNAPNDGYYYGEVGHLPSLNSDYNTLKDNIITIEESKLWTFDHYMTPRDINNIAIPDLNVIFFPDYSDEYSIGCHTSLKYPTLIFNNNDLSYDTSSSVYDANYLNSLKGIMGISQTLNITQDLSLPSNSHTTLLSGSSPSVTININVKTGQTFTVKEGAYLELLENSKLVVENGGTLVVENGSTIYVNEGAEIVIAAGGRAIINEVDNLSISHSSGTVSLAWDAYIDCTGYHIYRSTKPDTDFVEIGTSSTTSFTDTNTPNIDGVYFYKVIGEIEPTTTYTAQGLLICEPNEGHYVGFSNTSCVNYENSDYHNIALLFNEGYEYSDEIDPNGTMYHSISGYNNVAKGWMTTTYINNMWTGTVFPVSHGMALRINDLQSNFNFVSKGIFTDAPSYDLITGVNFIAHPLSKYDLTTTVEVAEDIGVCNYICVWNSTSQSWANSFLGGFGWSNEFSINAGTPIYINTTSNCVWPSSNSKNVNKPFEEEIQINNPKALYFHIVDYEGNDYDFIDSDNKTEYVQPKYDHITFEAWVTGREEDIITEKTFGCGYEYLAGKCSSVYLNLGNFKQNWAEGDELNIEITDNSTKDSGVVLKDKRSFEIISNRSVFFGFGDLIEGSGDPIVLDTPTSIEEMVPTTTALHQNYPNPFNPVTQIKYDIAETSNVKLNIYNTNGQLVANLIDGKVNPGFHTANFDASKLNSGVYIYTLQVGDKAFSKKMVLIK